MPLHPIDGDDDPETIDAGTTHDLINSYAGNDTVYAGDGNDLVYGGDDDDALYGGYGGDRVFGGNGNDVIDGGWGSDRVYGGAGNDSVLNYSSYGNESVYGGEGNDYVYWGVADSGMFHGGKGLDHFSYYNSAYAGPLSVDISSGSGALVHGAVTVALTSVERLTIYGGVDADTVTGGRFKDQIQVYAGANLVDAGAGNDNVVYTVGLANTLEGGNGTDTLYVGGTSFDALAFSADGTVDDGHGSSITGFERFAVYGGYGYDSVIGGGDRDSLHGSRGNDSLYGGGGNDRLFGGGQDDLLVGGGGNDTLSGGAGFDVLTGDAGADIFIFGVGDGNIDVVTDFASGEDVLRVNANAFGISAPGGVVLSYDAASGTGGQFIYNTVSGDLLWDANGTATGGDRIIVALSNAVALDAADIQLV